MSSVIRYTLYSNAEAIAAAVKPGVEVALLAQTVTLPNIAANANANVFVLPTTGKILGIMSAEIRSAAGVTRVATHTITVDATRKIINIAVPNAGTQITAGDTLSLLLVIGV